MMDTGFWDQLKSLLMLSLPNPAVSIVESRPNGSWDLMVASVDLIEQASAGENKATAS